MKNLLSTSKYPYSESLSAVIHFSFTPEYIPGSTSSNNVLRVKKTYASLSIYLKCLLKNCFKKLLCIIFSVPLGYVL